MNKKDYLSQPTCKWLSEHGCEIESDVGYEQCIGGIHSDKKKYGGFALINEKERQLIDIAWTPAYSWSDVLIWKAKEFFGEEKVMFDTGTEIKEKDKILLPLGIPRFGYYTEQLLLLLQQGDIDIAEEYFKSHCVFNNKEK